MARLNAVWGNFSARGQAWDHFWQDAVAAGGSVTGTVSATQADNTVSAVGVLAIGASLVATQTGDTLVSGAVLAIVGALSENQSGDSLSSVGTLSGGIGGTLNQSQVGDTISATGTLVALPDDTRLNQILAILMGRKVYNNTTKLWRIYDQYGTEIADPSGILLRGLHGWLLQKANESIPSEIWYDITKHLFYTNLDEFKQINNQDLYLYENQLVKKLSTLYVMTL